MEETTTILGLGGRLVIPVAFRKALGIQPGDDLLMVLEDAEVRIFTPAQAIRRAQALVRRYIPGDVSLVDELIAERRAEAALDE